MTSKRSRPVVLTDAPEHRNTQRFEIRQDADQIELVGYASTWQPYPMYGGPENGGWIEQIDRHAFDKTLREKPDLHLLVNHEGWPLARTRSGTLEVSADDHGLLSRALLDRSDPDVQRLEPKMRRGDMTEMSFAFRPKRQQWSPAPGFENDPTSLRTLTEISIHKGDVSVVNWGANPTTHAEIKSVDQALELLAMCDTEALAEVRKASGDTIIRRAQAALDVLTGGSGRSVIDRGNVVVPAEFVAADAPEQRQQLPGGRAPMSVAEAYRRMGFGADDGSLMRTDEALQMTGGADEDDTEDPE